jgi:hypothetical protein
MASAPHREIAHVELSNGDDRDTVFHAASARRVRFTRLSDRTS